MNKLRILRITLAVLFATAVTLLFLDFTGTIHEYLQWVAEIQFIPALLAMNLIVVAALVALTLIFGRLYCSVICPLGVFQDAVSRFASLTNKKRKFSFSEAYTWLRWGLLAVYAFALAMGISSVAAILEPYSAFGRIASNLFVPIYKYGNNILAYYAEQMESYQFYSTEVVMLSLGGFIFALVTLLAVTLLAWRGGRTYCNTLCPVGTLLGFLSRYSWFKVVIDESKCNRCQSCVRACKASCISISKESKDIDYSRCVTCFDCIDSCKQGAIKYTRRRPEEFFLENTEESPEESVDNSKRTALTISAALLATQVAKGEEKIIDGGLAIIEDKKIPKRTTPVIPAGGVGLRHFSDRCTGCQLCVSACPNQVLRPRTELLHFMQPEMSFERGYCRPECNMCASVCPSNAINKISAEEKSSIQIGHAVYIEANCVVLTDGVQCDNCAAHCPVGAITMVAPNDKSKYGKRKIPMVDPERCIGCGACEHLCPARPFSAIYVEGYSRHKSN